MLTMFKAQREKNKALILAAHLMFLILIIFYRMSLQMILHFVLVV